MRNAEHSTQDSNAESRKHWHSLYNPQHVIITSSDHDGDIYSQRVTEETWLQILD